MGKEIVLDVSDEGEIQIETKGFKGKSCMKEAAFLEDVLGRKLQEQLTPAYFETNPDEIKKRHLNLCG